MAGERAVLHPLSPIKLGIQQEDAGLNNVFFDYLFA